MKQSKHLMVFLVSLMLFSSINCQAQKLNHQTKKIVIDNKDSALYNKLLKMDFSKYKGKAVSNFLNAVGINYVKYLGHTKRPGNLNYMSFIYSDSLSIEITVKEYKYLKPLNYDYKWSIEEFRKEKSYMICFKYAGECIKGCNEEDCN